MGTAKIEVRWTPSGALAGTIRHSDSTFERSFTGTLELVRAMEEIAGEVPAEHESGGEP